MRAVLCSVFLFGLLIGATPAAPAPYPKKQRAVESRHPYALCKLWTLSWYGMPYSYEFRSDGTYKHHKQTFEPDYSGTWEVRNGTLYVNENMNGLPMIKYEMTFHGKGWKCNERAYVHLADVLIDDRD